MDTWELIENKEFARALLISEEEYRNTQEISSLRNMVYSQIHLKRYEDVITTENKIISKNNGDNDIDFIFYGIALWFLDKKLDAIEVWKKGEKSKYTDAAGGIELQIILYFAALKVNDPILSKKYLTKIQRIVNKRSQSFWPLPLGQFLLGNINYDQVLNLTSENPILKERQLCQIYFVKSIKELEMHDSENYRETLFKVNELQNIVFLEQMFYLMKAERESLP